MLTDLEKQRMYYGPYPVTVIDNFKIPITADISLGSKIWLPHVNKEGSVFSGCTSRLFCNGNLKYDGDVFDSSRKIGSVDKFSVILEYIPYRKSDLTAQDDHGRYTWWCSYGFVCMRVDIRGTGDSDGLLSDEYSQEEQDDCLLLFEWLDKQPWFNGKVGMIGISWGGFNGLQMAYLQPSQLKTVISVCSTDDRYHTDVHYKGGCLTGDGMISWGTLILAWNALPPDPKYTRSWKDVWLSRLHASKPWMTNWLQHQKRDNYWKHGSISQNYSRIKCPTLLFGGWRDPYRDALFRMLKNLKHVKAIIGPWGHQWPHIAVPGPNIDFLKICLQWFDHHLKETNNNIMSEPKLRAYLQSYTPPNADPEQQIPGRWIAFDQWPDQHIQTDLFTVHDGKLDDVTSTETGASCHWETVPYVGHYGIDYCEWVEMSKPTSPPDQSKKKSELLEYRSRVMNEDYILFGNPEFYCFVYEKDYLKNPVLMVQLLDEAPSGESIMISYGVKKITPSKELYKPNIEGTKATFQLHALSHIIQKGHIMCLRISTSFWPNVWGSHQAGTINILTGTNEKNQQICSLKLPVLQKDLIRYYHKDTFDGSNIAKGVELPVIIEKTSHFEVNVDFLPEERLHVRKIVNDHGKVKLLPQNVSVENCCTEVCGIKEGCEETAYCQSEMVTVLQYKGLNQDVACDTLKYHTLPSFSNGSRFLDLKSDKADKEIASEEKINNQMDVVNISNTSSSVVSHSKSSDTEDQISNKSLHGDSDCTVKVHSRSCLEADSKYFHLKTSLKAELDNYVVYEQKWDDKIERLL